jgi:hypothetical protein
MNGGEQTQERLALYFTPRSYPYRGEPTEEKYMRSVEQHQLKEMPQLAEGWIAQDSTVSQDTTVKKVGKQVSDSETSRPEFVRLVAQCSILVVIGGIVAGLIAA